MGEIKRTSEGTDVSKLEVSSEDIPVEILYAGEVWKFKFREITYIEKMRYSSQIYKAGKMGTQKLALAELAERIFTETVKGAPEGFNYRKMKPDFGTLLHAKMPGMKAVMTIEDEDEGTIKN